MTDFDEMNWADGHMEINHQPLRFPRLDEMHALLFTQSAIDCEMAMMLAATAVLPPGTVIIDELIDTAKLDKFLKDQKR